MHSKHFLVESTILEMASDRRVSFRFFYRANGTLLGS